jgi:hypothetical protein
VSFRKGLLQPLSQHSAGTILRLVNRCFEACDGCLYSFQKALRGLLQHQLIKRHDCEERIVRLDPNAVSSSHFRYEAL